MNSLLATQQRSRTSLCEALQDSTFMGHNSGEFLKLTVGASTTEREIQAAKQHKKNTMIIDNNKQSKDRQ